MEAIGYLHVTRGRLERELINGGPSITSSVVVGNDVARALIDRAEHQGTGTGTNSDGRADLIAIATHGHGAMQRRIMGSVAEQMLSTTTIPLFLIRPH